MLQEKDRKNLLQTKDEVELISRLLKVVDAEHGSHAAEAADEAMQDEALLAARGTAGPVANDALQPSRGCSVRDVTSASAPQDGCQAQEQAGVYTRNSNLMVSSRQAYISSMRDVRVTSTGCQWVVDDVHQQEQAAAIGAASRTAAPRQPDGGYDCFGRPLGRQPKRS